MRIQELHIQNFRGLEEIVVKFPKANETVFIGINGAGKSSVLDCIAIMLAQFVAKIRNLKKPDIQLIEDDINIRSHSTVNSITVLTEDGKSLFWRMTEGSVDRQNTSIYDDIDSYAKRTQENLKSHQDLNLPVMVYYQTHRMILKNPYILNGKSKKKTKKEAYYQFYAYEQAFSNNVNNFQDFFDWFREEEDYENEIRLRENSDYRNPKLEVIRKAIVNFLSGFADSQFSNLRVVRSTDRDFNYDQNRSKPSLTITKNNHDLKLEQLSDGEKIILMLVTDLARRLAIANPSNNDALLGEGIVLIDEIDLHLHPQWQRTIIPSFIRTFPNCQFIVTTHSPQVLSEVRRENIFILEDSRIVEKTPYTYGKDSNSILYELMNVQERPYEVQQQIDNCFQLIEEGNIEAAKAALNELSNLLGENDREVVRANTLIGFLE